MGLGGPARDDRRRRVLLDETLAGERPAARGAKSGRRRRSYADAALNDLQPRASDLIPVRPPTLTLLFGAALTILGTIVTLHVHRDWFGTEALAAAGSPLALNARGGLADWASSSMFLIGALVALQIFSVRRHRLDDYRGSYRVWLWIAPILLWLSVDSVTHLRGPLAEAIVRLPWFGKDRDPSWWWPAAYAVFFGMVVIRLIIETRRCRAAWPCWIAALVLYGVGLAAIPSDKLDRHARFHEGKRDGATATATPRPLIELPDSELQVLLARGVPLLGHWLALLGLSLYARHVRLDASGAFLPKKKSKKGRPAEEGDKIESPAAEAASKDGRIVRADGAHAGPNKPHAGVGSSTQKPGGPLAGRGAQAQSSDDEEDDDEDDDSKMSRAERRRLKRSGK